MSEIKEISDIFSSYSRKNDFLVCVDSDGCAMDTMNCKHIHCFGPCMITEWQLEKWESEILKRWNEINLFSMTRGINRFKGLAIALLEINDKYKPIDGIKEFKEWADNAPTLSNDSVLVAANEYQSDIFYKALNWSKAVNESIVKLPEELKVPYEGTKEGLNAAHKVADVAVVSSANRGAVDEEWTEHKLYDHVDIVLAQDCGSKASCIEKMLMYGYNKENVVMVGDAPGDLEAAKKNGVWFYPILVNHEKESWEEFKNVALPKLIEGDFEKYSNTKIEEFLKNLGA